MTAKGVVSSAICTAILAVSGTAFAQEPQEPGTSSSWVARTEPRSRWYGWQTLAIDGPTLTGMVAAFAFAASKKSSDATDVVGFSSFAGYAIGAPIVHLAHGHEGKALGSLGMRLGCPLAGGLLGLIVAVAADSKAFSGEGGGVGTGARVAFGGVGLGMLVPIILDAALLAYEPVRQPVREPVDEKWTSRLVPTLGLARGGGATGGVAGTF